MLGRTLRNHYQIIKFLGKGGFGHTYLAKDLDLPGHPQCVVKHLKPQNADPDLLLIAKRLFETEAQTLYKLGSLHDQIPKLSAHFEENGEFYLVPDFIAGHDLTKELIPGKKLSESYTITLLHNILEILAIVHRQKVIHRDLKPDNLMRRQDGKIVLIDFGAVKEISTIVVNAQKQTSLTIAIGTPGYMPSEQAKGKPRFASDIHAGGMIGIQALTGEHPFNLREDTRTGEVIWRNQAQVSNNLANVLDKMVRDNFSQRYQNADEALQAILSLLSPLPPPPPPPTPTPTPTPPTRRGFLQLVGFAGVGLVGAVVTKSLLNNSSNPLKTVQFETVTVNSRGEITKRSQSQAQVFTETIANGITLEMMAIPGGSFVMGSPNTEARRFESEGPQRTVNLAPFFMGKYEVTQEQWEAVMGNNPSYFKGAKLPVEQVSWNDAVQFCQKLSQKTGKNYRLPSEAEWEYTCRAGTTTPFYFGETITPDLVNYDGNSYPYGAASKGLYRAKTTDVGSCPPNAFGLYDMHGNVSEWCSDRFHSNYNGAPTDGTSWETGTYDIRAQRGGSWYDHVVNCRAACRHFNSAGNSDRLGGFRVAVALVSSSS